MTKILLQDDSQTLIGRPTVKDGKIKLEFECAHDKVQVMFGEVLCEDCRKILNDKEVA